MSLIYDTADVPFVGHSVAACSSRRRTSAASFPQLCLLLQQKAAAK